MPHHRNERIEKLRQDGRFDVIVIGGGINGLGTFRELALQGLRVLLIERNDFCSGCSSAPSRMIHGGLRYLENGEFDLVRESLQERDALLANAPHLVKPLPTTVPINSVFSGLLNGAASFLGLSEKPARRGALAVKLGLALYDWTIRKQRVLPKHSFRGASSTYRQWPELCPNLNFSATYYDAWISHPERLGVELILDTAQLAPDSIALNYAEVEQQGTEFKIRDRIGGWCGTITAKAIVNATGAWLDDTIAMLDVEQNSGERLVAGTKGSHLILANPRLLQALAGHMIFFENSDGRVCIVFPYLGNVLAGATDIRVERATRVRCEADEQAYILAALQNVFPKIAISSSDVVYSYSGIRPLPKSDHAFTGRISRGHHIQRLAGPVPQFCMVGGKWTTFRAFAEQTTDAVLAELGQPRRTTTHRLAIGGGRDFGGSQEQVARLMATHAIDHARAEHLIDAYGSRADDVLAFCRQFPDDRPLSGASSMTRAEIIYLIRHEYVEQLADLLQRRSALTIRGQISSELISEVARILAGERGWNDRQMTTQIADFTADLASFHGVSREMLEQRNDMRRPLCA